MPASLQAALLGIVQGLTEFLPVSSSAHLILARAFFGYDADRFGLPFDVALHVGTALAVVAYFHRDIARLLAAVPRALAVGPRGLALSPDDPDAQAVRLLWLLAIGTVPIVIVGGTLDDLIETHLRTPRVAAAALATGAAAFLLVERLGQKTRDGASLTIVEALLIGGAQALALVPGVSRSGATITVALLIGLRRTDAARFIFLLGVPAILGAAAKEAPALSGTGAGDVQLMLIGVVSSAIVGYLAVRFFVRYLGRHSLDVFAWYRLGLAAAVVAWLIAGGAA